MNRITPPKTVYVWGKKCRVECIVHPGRPKGMLEDGIVKMYVRRDDSPDKIYGRIEKWQKKILLEEASAVIKKWESVIKIKINRLTVRKMRTRFGSAKRSAKTDGIKYITLALMLARFKPEHVEYVIVHEMAHLAQKKMNHGREFHKLMDKYLPAWKKLKRDLRKDYLAQQPNL
jgi:predicted metal-dependent hydrolase